MKTENKSKLSLRQRADISDQMWGLNICKKKSGCAAELRVKWNMSADLKVFQTQSYNCEEV